jgi:hypothetical protein
MEANKHEFLLSDEEFNQLQHTISTYRRETAKCRKAGAYLAGCVMAAASLEALLLGMVQCFPEEALSAPSCPKRRTGPKKLRQWGLSELLAVARELTWLPAELTRQDEFDTNRAAIGDYTEVVRQIRNLVHPVRYLEEMPQKRFTKKYLEMTENIIAVASEHLCDRLAAAILKDNPEDG